MLEAECRAAQVQIFLNTRITEVQRTTEFILRSNSANTTSQEFRAPILIVATGGLSIPKMGATSFGYDLARQFGHKLIPTRPALVPFVFQRPDQSPLFRTRRHLRRRRSPPPRTSPSAKKCSSLIADSAAPAILQISSYWKEGQPIQLDLAPERDVTASLRATTHRDLAAARNALQEFLPKRFATRWLEFHAPPSFNNPALATLEQQLHAWTITPATTEGYEKAEVTAGGVDTRELSSKSMESRNVPGLFFIGEVVDVTGHLGGFNFQWAWASAAAAARSL